MARLHSYGSGVVSEYGAVCMNLSKEQEFRVEQFDTVARCNLKYTKVKGGTPIHVFAFVGEMTKDQAVKIAAILKE
jgi:hypothetical protein